MGHLEEQGETYWQHFRHAIGFAGVLFLLLFVCLTHAIIPNVFTTTASDRLILLIEKMKRYKVKINLVDTSPESKTPKN